MSSESGTDIDYINRDVLASPACADAFGRMFWAFVFFLDFKFGVNDISVDLLPDFVGWILIVTALGKLLELSPRVGGMKKLAGWLLFISIFSVIEIKFRAFESWQSPFLVFGLVLMGLRLLFIWRLCALIMDMAKDVGDRSIYAKAEFRRLLYLLLVLATAMVTLSALLIRELAILVLFVLPPTILVFFLLMGLMLGTKEMCQHFAASAIDGQ